MINEPKVSIITVSYNAVKTIEQSILSVMEQNYSNLEYIIIDGASTDGTIDIIKRYEKSISYWISEIDNGIYDAMNKGIGLATGEWIYFLGADDALIDSETIEKISLYLNNKYDLVCGRVFFLEKEKVYIETSIGRELEISDIMCGQMAPHQGMFVKSTLMKKELFNLEYKVAADFDFFCKVNLNRKKFLYINQIVAFFSSEGCSSNIKNIYLEYYMILKKYNVDHRKLYLLKKRFTTPCFKRFLKYILKSTGTLYYFKKNFLKYNKHKCCLKKCRWCNENAEK